MKAYVRRFATKTPRPTARQNGIVGLAGQAGGKVTKDIVREEKLTFFLGVPACVPKHFGRQVCDFVADFMFSEELLER